MTALRTRKHHDTINLHDTQLFVLFVVCFPHCFGTKTNRTNHFLETLSNMNGSQTRPGPSVLTGLILFGFTWIHA